MLAAPIAAGVNLLCFVLLRRLNQKDVNLRAATTFSLNDFIASGGAFLAGGLVRWTGSKSSDLIVGIAIAAVAMKGGIDILTDAKREAPKAEKD